MAQQTTHNVVSHSESTSGQPPVDVAANQSVIDSAVSGAQYPITSKASSHDADASALSGNPFGGALSHDQSATLNGHAGSFAVLDTADPSAGDAVQRAARVPAASPASSLADRNHSISGEGVNGLPDEHSQDDGPADDKSTADVSIDVSANSDTDTSKADASEKKEGRPLNRNNSAKKSTVFSKVSITRSFLAKTATAAPAVPKPGDKLPATATVAPPVAKPRLVAKTGATLRESQKARLGSDAAGSPDPSKVWNKNQPVAPPPPKQFTDEELKQQYGIHLATRLQSDEGGKESKWADIDDDEEDWAPDTIAWMDGTKSTVNVQEATAPAKDEPPIPPQPVKPAETAKPTLISMKRPDQSMNQSMKILKPGVVIIQAKQSGSASPSPGADKQSLLKSKSSVSAPTKSPWAPIPKVESVSPINPPVQQLPPPPSAQILASQDARAYDTSAPPPPTSTSLPAREIATDTFDRSWKEGEGGARELFNSSNGRYEPAPERRRNSVKPDAATLRKTAVLRRPSQSHGAPPELPSPVSRTAPHPDETWGRRRGSSVSQGSAPARRLSRAADTDDPEGLQSVGMARASRSSPQPDQLPAGVSPVNSQAPVAEQQSVHTPVSETGPAAAPTEDPVKMQERVMREKREMAIKRRKEEAEREEAAKQERLKAKLAALQGAGKSKKEREAEAAATKVASSTPAAAAADAEPTAESSIAQGDTIDKTPSQQTMPLKDETLAIPPTQPTLSGLALSSPDPNPQASTDDANPARAASEDKPSLLIGLPEKKQASQLPHRSSSSDQAQKPTTARAHLSPTLGARVPYQPPAANAYKGPTSSLSSPRDRKLQPYLARSPNLGGDSFTPWGTTIPNGNVWGASGGIGNGTFEKTSSFAPVPMSQQSSALPPPPGMARPSTSARISPQNHAQESRSPNLQAQSVEELRPFASSTLDSRTDPFGSQSRMSGPTSTNTGLARQAHPPGPIGPPSRSQPQQQPAPRADPVSAWNNAAQRLSYQLPADAETPLPRNQESAVLSNRTPELVYKETFKKTSTDQGKLGEPRRFDKKEYNVHLDPQASNRPVSGLSPAPPSAHFPPSHAHAHAHAHSSTTYMTSPAHDPWRRVTDTVRISDTPNMPAQTNALPTLPQPPIRPPSTQSPLPLATYQVKYSPVLPTMLSSFDNQSPPPPESEGHPVNAGSSHYPLVKLPPPQAKVKLPPQSPSSNNIMMTIHSTPVLMPHRPAVSHKVHPTPAPITASGEWQRRINGLFNRTHVQTETPPSPPKTPPKMQGVALAVTPSSRALMEYPTYVITDGATVSLPLARSLLTNEGGVIDETTDTTSKPTIDKMFSEELSFGSLPRVLVPRNTKYNLARYSDQAMANLRRFPRSPESQSYTDVFTWYKSPYGYFVKIPRTRLNNKLVKFQDGRGGTDARKSGVNFAMPDRKTSGRFAKNKTVRFEGSAPAASSSTPTVDRKHTTPKPPVVSTTANATSAARAAATNDVAEDSKNADRTKSSWHKSRFPRHSQAAPIKSN